MFAGGPDADDEGDGHAGSEAEDVYKGVAAVPAELAKGDEEIIFEHVLFFYGPSHSALRLLTGFEMAAFMD